MTHPLHHEAQRIVETLLPALRQGPADPWHERTQGWALDWLARSAQAAQAPAPTAATHWRAACEAAAALRALLTVAPAEVPAAAPAAQAVETWLAQAHAYLAAAEPVPPATPPATQGPALQATHQHAHRLQPNSAWCFVCGLQNPVGLKLRFLQVEPGRARAYAVVPEAYQGYPGVVHGGVVAAMLDEVTGRAGTGTDPATARLFYTARLTIRYRRHVPTQRLLRLEGWVVRDKGRFYEAEGAIYDHETGETLAQAQALLAEVPRSELARMDPEAIGWRVYPLEECPP